jgi:hypothetical protein
LEAAFVLLEFSSPSRRIFIGSHSLPPSLVHRIGPSEDQLLKSRKHAAAKQSKLDAAFAKYQNDVQDMHAKSDDLVRRNKTLRNKNKGMPHGLLGSCLEVER